MQNLEKKTVLIIEDEDDIRSVYVEILKDEGFRVLEAIDGSEGLNKAINNYWDIMLLDIVIPKVDGITILKKVRENAGLKTKPIILLTNLGSEDLIKQSFEFGADGYLMKSEITPDKILNEVKSYLK